MPGEAFRTRSNPPLHHFPFKSRRAAPTSTVMEEIHQEAYQDELGLLTEDDIAFVHVVIGRELISASDLNALLNDGILRRQLLDSPALYDAIARDRASLHISEFFYYCTIVRQAMLAAGLEEPDYTDNVSASLVRMAHMQRKCLQRQDSCSRYLPVNLSIIKERGAYGSHIRIYSRMDPYEMLLEGFQVDVGAFAKIDPLDAASA